jgi:hypothetical protein
VERSDWARWPRFYDRPGGALGQRLLIVQRLIRESVGANRWPHEPVPLERGRRLFTSDPA